GATLCFGSRQTLYSAEGVLAMLRDNAITHALLPPSLLGVLPTSELPELKYVAAIGEKCSGDIAVRWSNNRYLCNAYGPAEATITVSVYEASNMGKFHSNGPPIGRPLANLVLYVLGRDRRPVPTGVHGELCIGGIGV